MGRAAAKISASADQGGNRHVDSSAARAPVETGAPAARSAGRAEAERKASPALHKPHPITLTERRAVVAYGRDYAERVTRAEVRGRLTKRDRKLIVRHVEVVISDIEAGLHR